MRIGEVLTALRDHIDAQVGGQVRDPVDAWHYSPWVAEMRAAAEQMAAPMDAHSYSIAVQEVEYVGLDGGGWPRDACSGREVRGLLRLQLFWRVALPFTGEPHDDYVSALDEAHVLIAALLDRPVASPALPITVGLRRTRAGVTEARYVEGVTEFEAEFPLYLSTGG